MQKLQSKNTDKQVITSGPTAPLPKDPQPSVDRIDDLARRILSGDILLPKFQRDLVWTREQILLLLDSVAKGFPIGSVLLWQSRQELRSENRIASLDIELPRPDYPVNYLLDGQQRLSAICGALFWTEDSPNNRWNIVYDLRAQEFLHLDTIDDPPLHQIRVNKIPDPSVFFQHVASLDTLTAPDKAVLKERATALFNRFKDYKIATVTLADMSIEDVAPIFERINSTGTQLTIVDLMRAATWSPEFDLFDEIDEVLRVISERGFGDIDRRVVLRNISASAGGGFTEDSIDQLRKHDADTLKEAVKVAEDAYRRAVDFLVTQIRVDNARIIPYSNQITVLVEIFRSVSMPTAEQYKAIERWFWQTAAAGYFSGWNSGQMNSDLRTVHNFAQGKKTEIEFRARRQAVDVWETRTFRTNAAHTKLLAIVLAHHQPIDLLTGRRIETAQSLAWNNTKEFHHFFPKDYLKSQDVSVDRRNVLANIIMLTSGSNKKISNRAPSEYLKDVASVAGSDLERWLSSNLISMEAYQAALHDDYDRFLRIRAQTLDNALDEKTDG